MLSIYRDTSGKTVVDVTGCESIKEVKTVKMTNLGLTDFDQQMFSEMKNIEEMDISGNKLDTIPEYISLPKLKRLNCSKNRFTDITFIGQFPNLEEMDIRDNKISFSDHCIACELCPRLKRVNQQELNIDKLKEKLESRLKPLISRVWLDHFMSTFDERMTMEEFEAIGEKFRTILKHSNIPVTKVVMKFKDFKLMQLVDRFLKAIREHSEGTLFGISNCTTERSQKSYAAKKPTQSQTANDIEFVPVTLPASDTPEESTSASVEADPEMQDSTVYVLTGDSVDPDTVYILTEDCDSADLSNMVILTENGEVTENGKKALQAIVDEDCAVPETSSEPRVAPEEVDAQQVEGRVTKFLPGPISWGNPQQEPQSGPNSSAPEKVPVLPSVAKTTKPKPTVKASTGQPKVVKYWLYDEEIKPLRKVKKPETKKPSKRPDLSKYIVGPASEFSMASRRATQAAAESIAAAELPETTITSLPEDDATEPIASNSTESPEIPNQLVERCAEKEVLLDLWSDTPHTSDVAEETVERYETNHVSEATLLLDLSQSRPALHVSEAMDIGEASAVVDSSGVTEAAVAVSDAAEEDTSTSCPYIGGRAREEPDKGMRVPPKKRVRFMDEVQTEPIGEEGCTAPEDIGNCAVEASECELSRPSVAEDT